MNFDSIPEENIFEIPHKGKLIFAKVIEVLDGDTMSVLFHLKNEVYMKARLRICGIDTPEKHPLGRGECCDLEKQCSLFITQKVKERIEGKVVQIRIHSFDKYGGRYIGELYQSAAKKPRETSSLGKYLVQKGYAREYGGDKKKEWTREELEKIIS
jgi:endonuclease YncB( thermonuclease family)